MGKVDTERKVRAWNKDCTLELHVLPERPYWVTRQLVPGAMSIREAVECLTKDGYKFVGYGYTPYGLWGAEMLTPLEEYWFCPESNEIHTVVVRAWERAFPEFGKRGHKADLQTYSWLHTQFFGKYHCEYMPTTEKTRAGVNQKEVVDLLVVKLDELLENTYLRNQRWEKRAKQIVEKVKDYIIYED